MASGGFFMFFVVVWFCCSYCSLTDKSVQRKREVAVFFERYYYQKRKWFSHKRPAPLWMDGWMGYDLLIRYALHHRVFLLMRRGLKIVNFFVEGFLFFFLLVSLIYLSARWPDDFERLAVLSLINLHLPTLRPSSDH